MPGLYNDSPSARALPSPPPSPPVRQSEPRPRGSGCAYALPEPRRCHLQVQAPVVASHEMGAWNAQKVRQGPVQSDFVMHAAMAPGTLQVVPPLVLLLVVAAVLLAVEATVVVEDDDATTLVDDDATTLVDDPPKPLVLDPPKPLVDDPPAPVVVAPPPTPLVADVPPAPVVVLVPAPVVEVPVEVDDEEPLVAPTPTPPPSPRPVRSEPCAQLTATMPPTGMARRMSKRRIPARLSQGFGVKGKDSTARRPSVAPPRPLRFVAAQRAPPRRTGARGVVPGRRAAIVTARGGFAWRKGWPCERARSSTPRFCS